MLTLCPRCGSPEVVWIGWGGSSVSRLRLAQIDGARLVAAGRFEPALRPLWACLACQPGWLAVHELAREEERCQLQIEEAVAARDYDMAVKWRDDRDAVHKKIAEQLVDLGIEPA
jgi:hypothetical protein